MDSAVTGGLDHILLSPGERPDFIRTEDSVNLRLFNLKGEQIRVGSQIGNNEENRQEILSLTGLNENESYVLEVSSLGMTQDKVLAAGKNTIVGVQSFRLTWGEDIKEMMQ